MQYKLVVLGFAIGALLICSAADANAQSKAPESIASWKPYIGQWQGKMESYGDRPAGVLRVNCKSIVGDSYLRFDTTFNPDGSDRTVNVESVLIGYDGRTKSAHAWCFARLAQAQCDIKMEGTNITMKDLTYVHATGTESVRTVSYELNEDDQFVIQITDVKHEGEEMPDWPTITLSREK